MAAKFDFSTSMVQKGSNLVEKMFQKTFGRCSDASNVIIVDDCKLLDLMLEAYLRAVLTCVSETDKYFEMKETIKSMFQ